MKRLLILLSSLVVASSSFAAKPNILFLLSDDHSYPFLSCYGDTNVKTPTLDQLAAEGMKLHRFFTSAPQCVPSRASLMTGRSPVAARITRFSSPLAKDEITLPELLRSQAGYFTGICGRSYHLDGSGAKNAGSEMAGILEKLYELYDLDADPSELNNLSGKPGVAAVERSLRLALTEKMILDFDHLPLPDLMEGAAGKGGGKKGNGKVKKKAE